MNTLSNMPQQLCSQCGGNEGPFPPDSEMSKEAQHMVPAAVPLCHPHCSWTPARPPDCRLEGIVPLRRQRPSELCFALFMLTNRLLHFLSHICLLVALLRVFFFPFFAKVNHQGQKPLYTILCTPRVKWEKWGWSLESI